MRKRKAFYWTDCVSWIAYNDDPGDMDPESIRGNTIVKMVEDLSGRSDLEIAEHIVSLRKIRNSLSEGEIQHLPGYGSTEEAPHD